MTRPPIAKTTQITEIIKDQSKFRLRCNQITPTPHTETHSEIRSRRLTLGKKISPPIRTPSPSRTPNTKADGMSQSTFLDSAMIAKKIPTSWRSLARSKTVWRFNRNRPINQTPRFGITLLVISSHPPPARSTQEYKISTKSTWRLRKF